MKEVAYVMVQNNKNILPEDLLYDKTVLCPVCRNKFKARALKKFSYRIVDKSSDFFINYSAEKLNPYFYDVWLCNSCGYTTMKTDFEKIRASKKELVIKNISSKWRPKDYPNVYDENIAIERFKLALLTYTIIGAPNYMKAMNCLKIAWVYRILKDNENEVSYMEKALAGFNEAYIKEDFPMYGMDRFTLMYLIGELSRRLNKEDESLIWFSNVLGSTMASSKIKSLTRDQRDLIKEKREKNSSTDSAVKGSKEKGTGLFKLF
ncbi:MAG: DUF2225 domain-containing protein [Clostridium sp.]|nr:DUF2225 domain-containing protein [Clostridium sp.]